MRATHNSLAPFAFINPPKKIPIYLRFLIWLGDKIAGKKLLPARLMAWAPRMALSSGILEAAAVKPEGQLTTRLLKLVRLHVSLNASCAFCFDMNVVEYEQAGLTSVEIAALQQRSKPTQIKSLSRVERIALIYAGEITATPIAVSEKTVKELQSLFSEREILLLAAVVVQVNYWARFMQALGVPPAGFSHECMTKPRFSGK